MAGYFDGEGCVSIVSTTGWKGKRYLELQVGLTSADKENLELFSKYFGGEVKLATGYKNIKRELYYWRKGNSDAQQFLRELLPYLLAKKEVAQLALLPTWVAKGGHTNRLTDEELAIRSTTRAQISAINNRITVGRIGSSEALLA